MYRIAVTAIIIRDGKILITKRHPVKRLWPNKWTFPGGGLEDTDFIGTPTEVNNQWYHTLENCVRREVREEVGLEVDNIKYLCNIAIPRCVIISFTADYKSGFVQLQKDECIEYSWIGKDDLDKYDFIDGLVDELRMVL